MTKSCPACGAPLPEETSFCPYCTENLRPRQAVEVPVRWWIKWLKRMVTLLVLAALAASAFLLYDALTPDTYDGRGELTYHLNGSDYHLAVTFRNDGAPEPEYTVQTIEDWNYDRAAKILSPTETREETRDRSSGSRFRRSRFRWPSPRTIPPPSPGSSPAIRAILPPRGWPSQCWISPARPGGKRRSGGP